MFLHFRKYVHSNPAKLVVKIALLPLVFISLAVSAQTNRVALTNQSEVVSNPPAHTFSIETNQGLALAQRVESMRAV